MEFSSKLLEKAVNEMAQLPGIGKRTPMLMCVKFVRMLQEITK
jgi:recombination protein RecR